MANAKTHLLVGAGVGVALYIADRKLFHKKDVTMGGIMGSLFLGMVGGLMADWLEPASHPNHRKFFHSLVFMGGTFLYKDELCEWLGLGQEGRKYFDWFISAYGSHLVLDSATAKGLPII